MRDHRKAYREQKRNAKRRGIAFSLTFDEWMEFWGDDLKRRGRRWNNLQMQRMEDRGGYHAGNIRKGTPMQNSKTAAAMKAKRDAELAGRLVQERLDAAMFEPSAISDDLDWRDPSDHPIGEASTGLGMRRNRLWDFC